MSEALEALARDEVDAVTARAALWSAMDADVKPREAYSALCRWTWRVTVERRLDDGLRDWHRLLLDAAARLAGSTDQKISNGPDQRQLDCRDAAERIRALADLVRMSVEAAMASVPSELGARAHVLEILRCLATEPGSHMDRQRIRDRVGLGEANLSRIMTLLVANGLVERLPRGKVAAFRVTQNGLALVEAPNHKEREKARIDLPPTPVPSRVPLKSFKSKLVIFTTFSEDGPRIVETGGQSGPQDHEPLYRPPTAIVRQSSGSNTQHRFPRLRERTA